MQAPQASSTINLCVEILLIKALNSPIKQYCSGRKLLSQITGHSPGVRELLDWRTFVVVPFVTLLSKEVSFTYVFLKSYWHGSFVLDQIIQVVDYSNSSVFLYLSPSF
jgi:hypothetical protein